MRAARAYSANESLLILSRKCLHGLYRISGRAVREFDLPTFPHKKIAKVRKL